MSFSWCGYSDGANLADACVCRNGCRDGKFQKWRFENGGPEAEGGRNTDEADDGGSRGLNPCPSVQSVPSVFYPSPRLSHYHNGDAPHFPAGTGKTKSASRCAA